MADEDKYQAEDRELSPADAAETVYAFADNLIQSTDALEEELRAHYQSLAKMIAVYKLSGGWDAEAISQMYICARALRTAAGDCIERESAGNRTH